MDISESDQHHSVQSATTPADTPDQSHGEKLKMMNSTPNGYNTLPNHKTKIVEQAVPSVKKHDSKHTDSSKHSSDSVKKKDGDVSKHSSSSSSHSKHKESSHKTNDISRPKDHDKDKKHVSHSKHSHSDHSKHSGSKQNGTDKEKSSSSDKHKKEHKSSESSHKHSSESAHKHSSSHKHSSESSHKHSSESSHRHSSEGKSSEKSKDKSLSEHKIKDKSKEHGDHKEKKLDSSSMKDKHEKHKDKSDKHKHSSSEKPKDKSSEKHKEKPKDKISSEKPKEKTISDKPKEKTSSDKPKEKTSSDKPKEKTISDKPKEKSVSDKPKEKSSSEKPKEKSSSDKPKEKSEVKVKTERDASPVKKLDVKAAVVAKVKQEPVSPTKVKDEAFSDDDLPLSVRKSAKESKSKPVKSYKEEDEDYEDEGAMDSDDEPILSRLNKQKKKAATKKRKTVDSEDEDDDYKKPVKKIKKEPAKASKVKKEPIDGASPRKKAKKEEEQEVWKWWEEEKKEDGVKWKKLQHHGPVFAPLYERVPKNLKFYYDGKHMELSEETEEVAGFYGRMLDHDYTTKDVFNTNFFKDWRKVMTPVEKEKIKDLKKCNFNAFNDYYKMKTEERKAMTKDQKAVIKKENEELTAKYGFCIIDGHKQKIGNFKIEPPGLFRGRGEHPKMGMYKRRIQPEDVIINIGGEADVPKPPDGHKWKKVLHDNKVTWLASWNENILNSTKYIMLNPSSKLKGEKDWQKYETARKLKNHAARIRKTYQDDFKSKEMKVRQRAVALYFIDKLALRAGNEKDEDTADTVGCCSLRVEHITLDEEKNGQEYVVSFDFLGKDSIRYENSVAVEKRAFKNLKLFMENKNDGDDLFDRLNTTIMNKYLNELMEGLTAKVFRTYNASKTLQEQLNLLTQEDMSIPEKVLAYNRANRAVAVLCNHQRAIPKTFSKSMENLKGKIDDKIAQIRECKKDLKQAKSDAKNTGSVKDKTMVEKKKKRLHQLEEQLQKLEVQATDKEENKQIALGTSKLNYLDPRISVAWCKKWNVPIEKIYNRTQRDKFRWAIEMAGPEFQF